MSDVTIACECWKHPNMHDSNGVCVNWDRHTPPGWEHGAEPPVCNHLNAILFTRPDGEYNLFAAPDGGGTFGVTLPRHQLLELAAQINEQLARE